MKKFQELLYEYRNSSPISAYEHSRQVVSTYFQNPDYMRDPEKKLDEMKKYIFFRAIEHEHFKPSKEEGVDGPLERLYDSLNDPKSDVNKILSVVCNTKDAGTRVSELESNFFKNAVFKTAKKNVPIDREALSEYISISKKEGLAAVQKKRPHSEVLSRATNYCPNPVFTAKEIDEFQRENAKLFENGRLANDLMNSYDGVQNDLSDVTRQLLKDNEARKKEEKLDPKKAPTDSYNKLISAIENYKLNMKTKEPRFIVNSLSLLKEAAEEYKAAHGGLRLSKGRERRNAASSIIKIVDKHLEVMEKSYKALTGEDIKTAPSPSIYDLYNDYALPYYDYKDKLDCMRMANKKYSETLQSIDASIDEVKNDNKLTQNKKQQLLRQSIGNRLATQMIAEDMKEKISKMDMKKKPLSPTKIQEGFSPEQIEKKRSYFNKSGHFRNYADYPDLRKDSLGYIKEIVRSKEAGKKAEVPDPTEIRNRYLMNKDITQKHINQRVELWKQNAEAEKNKVKPIEAPKKETKIKKQRLKEEKAPKNIVNKPPKEELPVYDPVKEAIFAEKNPYDDMFKKYAGDERYNRAVRLKGRKKQDNTEPKALENTGKKDTIKNKGAEKKTTTVKNANGKKKTFGKH